jgi:peptide/nickel transport system substrate-binding protein
MDWGEYLEATEDGEHDMCMLGWSADIADPSNFMEVLLHSKAAVVGTAANVAFYKSDEVDALLDAAISEPNQSIRDVQYKDAMWIIHKDSPWATIAHADNLAGILTSVSGFKIHPTGPGANVYGNVSKSGATELIIGRSGDSDSLDPAHFTDGQSWMVSRQIYDGLYNMPADSEFAVPALATGYTVSEDGLNYNLTLRQGVKFSDGTDFNASAVVFSFERARDWGENETIYMQNGWCPPEIGYYDFIYGAYNMTIEEIDTYTVRFDFDTVYGPFIQSLGMNVFAIVSPTYVKAHPYDPEAGSTDHLVFQPVGTGPYKLVSWEEDSLITLDRNPYYWGAEGKMAKIIFKVITENAARISSLTSSSPTIDITGNIAATDAKSVEDASGTTLISQSGMNVGYLAMNFLKEPFSNTTLVDDPDFGGQTRHGYLVARAINYAIDKDTIIEEVYQGRALKAKNPSPPGITLGYNDTIPHYEFNVTKAQEMLESLGYVSTPVTAGFDTFVMLVSTLGAFSILVIVRRKRR